MWEIDEDLEKVVVEKNEVREEKIESFTRNCRACSRSFHVLETSERIFCNACQHHATYNNYVIKSNPNSTKDKDHKADEFNDKSNGKFDKGLAESKIDLPTPTPPKDIKKKVTRRRTSTRVAASNRVAYINMILSDRDENIDFERTDVKTTKARWVREPMGLQSPRAAPIDLTAGLAKSLSNVDLASVSKFYSKLQ